MSGAVITGSFVDGRAGRVLSARSGSMREYGRLFVTLGVIAGLIASGISALAQRRHGGRAGDAASAREARGDGGAVPDASAGAGIVIIGQPDPSNGTLDNPLIVVPNVLSCPDLSALDRRGAGPRRLPRRPAPGQHRRCSTTATTSWSAWARSSSPSWGSPSLLLWRRRLFDCALDALDTAAGDAVPLHRQHRRLVDRRAWPPAVDRLSACCARSMAPRSVSSGNVLFTLLGFAGMYLLLGLLYVVLVVREAQRGPEPAGSARRGRRRLRRRLSARERKENAHADALVHPDSIHADHLRAAGRLRSRRGCDPSLRGQDRAGAARDLARHRPGLGRQRGLADRGGRHALLRLPVALCRPASAASTCR